jgi:hypothetical protein
VHSQCRLWVIHALATVAQNTLLSAVAPISDKMVRRGERSHVPIATGALQHDQRKMKDCQCSGLSEIRSGVLDQAAMAAAPSASYAGRADPTRSKRKIGVWRCLRLKSISPNKKCHQSEAAFLAVWTINC